MTISTDRLWSRIGPWLTPTLIMVEVVGVVTGLITVTAAAVVFGAVEVCLAVVVIINIIRAARSYRAGRAQRRSRWDAAEDGLAGLIPRRAAHVVLIEGKLWGSLASWVVGSHRGVPDTFSYRKSLSPLMWMVLALLIVEGTIVEFIALLVLGESVWTWILLALHGLGVLWLLGFIASLHTRPHRLRSDHLELNDGVFDSLAITYGSISAVRPISEHLLGRSGFTLDAATQDARLTHGDANVELRLHPDATIRHGRINLSVNTIRLSVDDRTHFISTLDTRL